MLPEDLHKFGMIPEFVGRLPVVAHVEELTEDDLVRILTEPKNALVKQYQRLFALEDVQLDVHGRRAARDRAAGDHARHRRARAARRSWSGCCSTSCTTCPAAPTSSEVVITEQAVRDGAEPTLVSRGGRRGGGRSVTRLARSPGAAMAVRIDIGVPTSL